MSNCRNTVLAVGPEAEVSRFVAFAVTETGEEETTFTEQFETGVLHRETGWVRLEVMSRWEPPIEVLADVSRQFPALRFAVEWEEAGDGRFGCASISNGGGEVVHLDKFLRRTEEMFAEFYGDTDGAAMEAAMEFRWKIMQQTARLLFGNDWEDRGFPVSGVIPAPFADLAQVISSVASRCGQQIGREEQQQQLTSVPAFDWKREGF